MQFVGPHKTFWGRGSVFRFVLASEQNYRVIMQSLFAVRRWEQQYDRPHASIGPSARAVPQRSRRYKNAVALCIPLLIKPVARVAPLRVTAMQECDTRWPMVGQQVAISFSRHALHRTNTWVGPCVVMTTFPFSHRTLHERLLSVCCTY